MGDCVMEKVEPRLQGMTDRIDRFRQELEYELAEIYVDALDANIFDEVDKFVISHTQSNRDGFDSEDLWENLKYRYEGDAVSQVKVDRMSRDE